jgi:hypothetical protein
VRGHTQITFRSKRLLGWISALCNFQAVQLHPLNLNSHLCRDNLQDWRLLVIPATARAVKPNLGKVSKSLSQIQTRNRRAGGHGSSGRMSA